MDWHLGCINIGTLSGTSKLGFWAKPNRALVSHSYGLCTHRVFSLGSCLTAEFSLEAIGGITEKPFVCKDLSHLFFLFFLGVEKEGFGNDGEDLHIRGDGGCHLCGAQWGRFTLWLDGSSPGKQGSALFLHSFFFLASFSYPFLFCSCELSDHKLLVGDHGNLATGFRLIYLQINRSCKLWKPGDVTPHLKWPT